MLLDGGSEYEPDEYDPEDDLPNYEEELPNVPEAPKPMPESEAPRPLVRSFWWIVVVVNYAILAVAVAAMLWFFRGQVQLPLQLVATGVIAAGYAFVRYRRLMARDDLWDGEESDPDGTSDDDESDADAAADEDTTSHEDDDADDPPETTADERD